MVSASLQKELKLRCDANAHIKVLYLVLVRDLADILI